MNNINTNPPYYSYKTFKLNSGGNFVNVILPIDKYMTICKYDKICKLINKRKLKCRDIYAVFIHRDSRRSCYILLNSTVEDILRKYLVFI